MYHWKGTTLFPEQKLEIWDFSPHRLFFVFPHHSSREKDWHIQRRTCFPYGSQEIAGGSLRLQGQRKDYKQAYRDLVYEWQRADHTHQTRSSSMVESMQIFSTLSFCLDYHCSFLRLQFPGKWEMSHAILNIRRPGRKNQNNFLLDNMIWTNREVSSNIRAKFCFILLSDFCNTWYK